MAVEELKRHKSQHNWLKQGVGQFILRSIHLFILFRIKRYCLRCGSSRSLYLFIRVTKQTIVIIQAHITSVNYIQNFIQHPAVKANSICRRNYWGYQCGFQCNRSTTDHTFWICYIGDKKWEYNEATYHLFIRFQESLWFSYEGGLVFYSHWVWYPHEMSKPNKNVSQWNLKQSPGRQTKQGNALVEVIFNYAWEYAIRRVQVNQDGLKLNSSHQNVWE